MKADEIEPSYRNDDDDTIMQRHMHDSRKPTITLLSLNKLKKMRAAKDLENLMRGDFMEIIYGSTGEEEAGAGVV
jgi:hypothetical protein